MKSGKALLRGERRWLERRREGEASVSVVERDGEYAMISEPSRMSVIELYFRIVQVAGVLPSEILVEPSMDTGCVPNYDNRAWGPEMRLKDGRGDREIIHSLDNSWRLPNSRKGAHHNCVVERIAS